MRSGFTLLETLIALVIAAMVTLVLLDSLSRVAEHASRLEQLTHRASENTLAAIPFRRALEAAVADYHDGSAPFTGRPDRVTGLTLQAVSAQHGEPAPFTLAIEGEGADTRLVYSETGETIFTFSLPADSVLQYRDKTALLHDIWPPADGFGLDDPEFFQPVPAAFLVMAGSMPVLAITPLYSHAPSLRAEDVSLESQ